MPPLQTGFVDCQQTLTAASALLKAAFSRSPRNRIGVNGDGSSENSDGSLDGAPPLARIHRYFSLTHCRLAGTESPPKVLAFFPYRNTVREHDPHRETFVKLTFARWRALPLRRELTRVAGSATACRHGFRALAIWLHVSHVHPVCLSVLHSNRLNCWTPNIQASLCSRAMSGDYGLRYVLGASVFLA